MHFPVEAVADHAVTYGDGVARAHRVDRSERRQAAQPWAGLDHQRRRARAHRRSTTATSPMPRVRRGDADRRHSGWHGALQSRRRCRIGLCAKSFPALSWSVRRGTVRGTARHPSDRLPRSGTCRMGREDDQMAVCDPRPAGPRRDGTARRGRLGVPDHPVGEPGGTVMALAERASDLVIADSRV